MVTIERGRGHYREDLDYWDEFLKCADSIQLANNSEEIRRIKALYDYNLRVRENQRLALANERKQAAIYRLFAITSILLLFLCGGLIHYLNRKRDWQLQMKLKEREKEALYQQSVSYMEKNREEIIRLARCLDEASSRNDHLSAELIRVRKESLEATNRGIELRRAERAILDENLSHSPLYVKFHTPGAQITAEDWKHLREELDRVYDLTNRLCAFCPNLSELEWRVCCLVKIRVKVRDMAAILNRSVSGISSVRGRLYTKITGEGNSPDKLDMFILDL